jgi:hypothetical protein
MSLSLTNAQRAQREAFDLLDRMRARGDTTPFFFFFAGLDATPLKEEILLHDAQGSSNDSGELKRFIEELLLSEQQHQQPASDT